MSRVPCFFTDHARRAARLGGALTIAVSCSLPLISATSHASAIKPAAGPTDTTMWDLVGQAVINNDPSSAANQVVRLTPTSTYKTGFAVYKPTVPASAGVDISFMMAQWGGTGRDGIAFFVKDARDTTQSFGAAGHPLGYGTRSGVDGLSGALLGIGFGAGFDSSDVDGTGCSYGTPPTRITLSDPNRDHTVTLRGGPGYGGNRRSNYCLLANPVLVGSIAPYNASYTTRAAAARAARITIDPLTDASPRIKVYYGPTLSNLTEIMDAPVPSYLTSVANLRIGFSGATGAATNNNEVWGLTTAVEVYDIAYDGQGGTLSSTSATYTNTTGASPLTLPTVTPRSGFDFLGWYSASSGGTQLAGPTDTTFTPTAPGTVYARWAAHQTVAFDANGGTGTATPQSSGIPKALDANTFTRAGYTFAGWSTSPNGPVVYADKAVYPFSGTGKLYAQWTAVSTSTVGGVGTTTSVAPGAGGSDSDNLSSSGIQVGVIVLLALTLLGLGGALNRSRRIITKP